MIGRWAFTLFAAALLSGSHADAAAQRELAVIPPGHEELFGAVLGRGATLRGQCDFAGASAERTMILARYRCASGEVAVELRHPDAAPEALRRTDRFAIVAAAGEVPAQLIDDLESRIRSREGEFEWSSIPLADGEEEENSYSTDVSRAVLIAALLLAAALALAWLSWLRRRAVATVGPRPGGIGTTAAAAALALLLCASVHGALRLTGASLLAMLERVSPASIALRGIGVAGLAVAASATAAALLRRRGALPRCAAAAVAVAYVAGGYFWSLAPEDLHYFGPLSTYPPDSTITETLAGQQPVSYGVNRFGFRVPEFAAAKADDAIRVALIGDSFVFGIGVGDDGTLHRHLTGELQRRWPERVFEVVNLGIPGNNLASHVTMYAVAVEKLDPDAVILALTFANDLSRWDEQDARRDARRPSPFSFMRFLVGDAAESIWALLFLERSTTTAGLAHLDREMRRLAVLQKAAPLPPLLVLFGFHPWGAPIAEQLARVDALLIADRVTRAEEFIPADGHPTSIGNQRSAAHIAQSLAASPEWQRLLDTVRPGA